MSLRRSSIAIKRMNKALNLVVPINCLVGAISILRDEEGTLINEHQEILTSEASSGASGVEREGRPIPLAERALLGFENFVDDFPSIGSFLLASGFHEDECEEIIRKYELEGQAYLPLRLLPPTAQRQLQLVVMLKTAPAFIVLNDPFMPFNGRWREAFAELLLEHVRKTQATVVVLNLSFRPKAWADKLEVREIDLIRENERALQRHCAMTINEENKVEQPADESRRVEKAPIDSSLSKIELEPAPAKLLWINKWGNAVVRGFAGVSSTVRSLHGAVAFLGLATLMAVVGYAGYPEAAKAWGKMRELGESFTYEWKSEESKPESVPASAENFAAVSPKSGSEEGQIPDEAERKLASARGAEVETASFPYAREETVVAAARSVSIDDRAVLAALHQAIASEWLTEAFSSADADNFEASPQMCFAQGASYD